MYARDSALRLWASGEKIKTQRGEVTSPRSHSWAVAELCPLPWAASSQSLCFFSHSTKLLMMGAFEAE